MQGNRNRAEETVVGITYTSSRIELVASNDACPERISAIKEIVGGGDIMLFKEVVAQITTQDDRQVVGIVHMIDTDKGQLLVEMPTGNFTSNDVPKIGIDGLIKQASGVELRYDGKPAVLGCDIALDVIAGFESRFALFFQVEVDLTVERGAYAVFSEIRMVEVIVTERHIRRDQEVSLKIGQRNNGRVDGVVAEVGGGGLIKRGIGEGGTNGGVDV